MIIDDLEEAKLRVGILYLMDMLGNPHHSFTMRQIIDRLNSFGLNELTEKWLAQSADNSSCEELK